MGMNDVKNIPMSNVFDMDVKNKGMGWSKISDLSKHYITAKSDLPSHEYKRTVIEWRRGRIFY